MDVSAAELEAIMERHAPAGYDPAADDMTVPFAIKLAEQDAKIERLQKALDRIIKLDRRERRTCVEFDSAGSTYEVEDIDGPIAAIARAALNA